MCKFLFVYNKTIINKKIFLAYFLFLSLILNMIITMYFFLERPKFLKEIKYISLYFLKG